MQNSFFSVLLSVYYKEKPEYLCLALDSIWNQTLQPYEIVIVKDGELTDDLKLILSEFSNDKPVKFIVNEQNMGLSYSLNRGLQACSCNWVARMDTDDICFPNRFEKQVQFLNDHPEIDILGSFATKINETGNEIELMKVPVEHKNIYKYIWTNPFIHPSVMFKKDKILSSGGYNPNSGIRMDDYELWFRCAKNKLIFANLQVPLLYYRFFAESIKKRTIKVGIAQLKVGLNGCKMLNLPLMAYIGITIPFIRSLLPYPLNRWYNTLVSKINPRNRKRV
jgi:glycosyltransferase involved in cell wall biosynthesis